MSRGRFTTRLALLAVPMTLGVAGVGLPWAGAESAQADEKPCKHAALSVLPISLCNRVPVD